MWRLLFVISITSVYTSTVFAEMSDQLKAVDFEVYGKVQGVFFRKYTKNEADKLNVRGWCMNTFEGTVKGHLEGPSDNVTAMMQWLTKTGSPKSVIEKAYFSNQKEIQSYKYQDFKIVKE